MQRTNNLTEHGTIEANGCQDVASEGLPCASPCAVSMSRDLHSDSVCHSNIYNPRKVMQGGTPAESCLQETLCCLAAMPTASAYRDRNKHEPVQLRRLPEPWQRCNW